MNFLNWLKSNKKELLINSSLIFSSVLFACIIGEFFVRFASKAWPFERAENQLHYLTEKDVTLKWRFSPDQGRNSLGLRNQEIGVKSSEIFRILFLGDSLVWSGETSSGKLYTEIIEKNLNNTSWTGKKIEVINAGIPGYTTYQELEFLKIYGLEMQPDMVILGVVFNDVYYKYLHKSTKKSLLELEPTVRLHRFNTNQFPGSLFAKSYLVHELTRLITKFKSPSFPFENRSDFYLAWKDYGWDNTRNLIGEMQQILNNKNIPLILVVYPVVTQVDKNHLKLDENYVLFPQQQVKAIALKYDIPFCDMTEILTEKGGPKLFADYLHLTNKGNDIVAEELTKCLNNNKINLLK